MRKLEKDGLVEEYGGVFENWLSEGIIELVPEEELDDEGHCLPHRHVVKPGSTTQVRPVFDASACPKDHPSLNNCLEKGLNIIELIPTINSRFRKRKIGVIADIKGAFLHVIVAPKNRNYLRFLWYYKGALRVFRHKRVVFGVSCSPFLLMAVIELLLDMTEKGDLKTSIPINPITFKLLRGYFYCNNLCTSVDTMEEVDELITQATAIFAAAKFELRGWEYTYDDLPEESKILGMKWNKHIDCL